MVFRAAMRRLFLPVVLGLSAVSGAFGQGISVLTFHGNAARLGWNAAETQLTPANVRGGSFGKLWQTPLDGGVPASPPIPTIPIAFSYLHILAFSISIGH